VSAPRDIRAPRSVLETCASCGHSRVQHGLVVVSLEGGKGITTIRGPCAKILESDKASCSCKRFVSRQRRLYP